jgi:glycosyltransferase involved in cell wall biosynthesis
MEMNNPLVSICIPVYDQEKYVKRLLDSIVMQDYKNIEVIVSDDSPHDEIGNLCKQYDDKLALRYFKHQPSLKTPKNWNFALDQASGDYIMLVHQDDFFAKETSVSAYLKAFKENKNVQFVFSRNTPLYDNGATLPNFKRNKRMANNLKKNVDYLVSMYVIGPPSNVMITKDVTTRYDERFIWLVDVDYSVRTIDSGIEPFYIDEHLVTIGMHPEQTTVFCYENPDVMLRENILYAQKRPANVFKRMWVFDYFWRLIRNYKVKSVEDIIRTGVRPEEIITPIKDIIDAQKKYSYETLRTGMFSKILMFKTLMLNKHKYI